MQVTITLINFAISSFISGNYTFTRSVISDHSPVNHHLMLLMLMIICTKLCIFIRLHRPVSSRQAISLILTKLVISIRRPQIPLIHSWDINNWRISIGRLIGNAPSVVGLIMLCIWSLVEKLLVNLGYFRHTADVRLALNRLVVPRNLVVVAWRVLIGGRLRGSSFTVAFRCANIRVCKILNIVNLSRFALLQTRIPHRLRIARHLDLSCFFRLLDCT